MGRGVRYAAGALLLVICAVAATVLWPRQSSDPGTGAQRDGGDGTYTATGPWRVEIHEQSAIGGCSVSVTLDGGDMTWEREGVYGFRSYQVPDAGTYRWTVNDPGCAIVPRATSGDVELPFAWQAYTGDTDAFQVEAPFTAEVRNLDSSGECELVLKDPSDGTTVDIRTATRQRPSVTLDPAGRSEVYLADLTCDVRVSA